jgi:hypothetical protein
MYNALIFYCQPVISWRLYGMGASLFRQRITALTLSLSHRLPTLAVAEFRTDPTGTCWGMVPPSSFRFDLH